MFDVAVRSITWQLLRVYDSNVSDSMTPSLKLLRQNRMELIVGHKRYENALVTRIYSMILLPRIRLTVIGFTLSVKNIRVSHVLSKL